jgi:two-component system chemotaxis sensor kinase CheA
MRYQFTEEDIEMLQAFIEESMESLQKIEDQILSLENIIDNSEALDNIFRQVHTIKGLSSFFSLSEITRLSHQAEYMLDAMRKGKLKASSQVVGVLLNSKDALGEMILQLNEACAAVPQGEGLDVEISSTHDVDLLIHEMKEFLEKNEENPLIPSDKQLDPLCQIPPASEKDSSDTEVITLLLDSLAAGMLEDFLLEADEHSGIIANSLLIQLDQIPEDTQALGDLFRRVHTLKGNTSLLLSVPIDDNLRLVLKELLAVLQQMESLLSYVRDTKVPISSQIINLCFEAIDALVSISTMLRKGVVITDDGKLKRLVTAMLAEMLAVSEKEAFVATESLILVPTSVPPSPSQAYGRRSTDIAGGSTSHSIRVSGEKLDRLMNVIGELAITKNVFSQIARKLIMEHSLPHLSREVKDAGQFVNRISAELEDAIMAMRMTEVRMAFQKFPRIIRDIALQTGKSIALIMEGAETELDKNIIEQIGDPLLHLVRNSGDHGIETLEERQAAGKNPQGNVWLRAYNRGKHVIIEVEDDGRGMNAEKLKGKAVDKGFITEQDASEMSDEQAFQLIFLPGFSMAKNVTELSGRGVGMDVVRSNITALQGTIKITSQLGKGSKIMMQLPLTLMVSRGLVIEVEKQLLVMPLDNVIETVKVPADKLVSRLGQRILYHRGEVLGVVSLAELLGMPIHALPDYTPVVIVTDGQSKVAMIVDKLLNEQDILVKPLPEYLSAIRGMGGATIMGDGKVALVLNPVELLQLAIR